MGVTEMIYTPSMGLTSALVFLSALSFSLILGKYFKNDNLLQLRLSCCSSVLLGPHSLSLDELVNFLISTV